MKKMLIWAFAVALPMTTLQAQTTLGEHIDNAGETLDNVITSIGEVVVDPVIASINEKKAADVIASDSVAAEIPLIEATPLAGDSYQQGVFDAQRMYPAKNTGTGGTFCTALFMSPLFGLIPAFLCTSNPPKTANLGLMSADKLNDAEYMRGYTEEAHKIKKKKVWTGYGVGSAAYFAILGLYYATYD